MIHNKGKFILRLAALVVLLAGLAAAPVPVAPQAPLILYEESAGNRNGNLSGRSGADALCLASANRPAGYINFRAFISVDANDEIRDMPGNYGVPTNVPIQSLGGTVIANDWADLLDGNIAVSLLNAGVLTGSPDWWSGSNDDGSLNASNCVGWTSAAGPPVGGIAGRNIDTDPTWIIFGTASCDMSFSVLCLAFNEAPPPPPPEPVGGVIVPLNKLELLAPWLGLVALGGLATLGVVLVRSRRKA
jgi:hypothetical protein